MAESIGVLTREDVLDSLKHLRETQEVDYSAFYSSHLGGVVTDPSLMVIPFDDHMVHRGHGIFDTAAIIEGKIYDLENHLDRFIRSAQASKLELPSREEMRDIVIRTSALSGRREGSIRYWASSGTGNLGLIPAGDAKPAFFVMIFGGLDYPERYYAEGMRVMTTTYPIKPPLYAVTKSTNYLPNTLMQMEAKEEGLDNGIFVDEAGNVGEGSNMNCAFVTNDGVLQASQVRQHPIGLHGEAPARTREPPRGARRHQRRGGGRHPGGRGQGVGGDDAHRKLDIRRPRHAVGRSGHRGRKARPRDEGDARAFGRGHALGRGNAHRRAVLVIPGSARQFRRPLLGLLENSAMPE